jgi:hypothetical protein
MNPPSTSPCISPTSDARPGISAAKAHQPCGGRCSRHRCAPRADAAPTMSTTPRPPNAPGQTGPGCRWLARSSSAAITCCESSATKRSPRPDLGSVRVTFSVTQMHRGQLHARFCRHDQLVDGPYRPSGRNAYPSGTIPPPIMSPAQRHPGPRSEIRLSARAHTIRTPDRAHAPPAGPAVDHITRPGRAGCWRTSCTDKKRGCLPRVRVVRR